MMKEVDKVKRDIESFVKAVGVLREDGVKIGYQHIDVTEGGEIGADKFIFTDIHKGTHLGELDLLTLLGSPLAELALNSEVFGCENIEPIITSPKDM